MGRKRTNLTLLLTTKSRKRLLRDIFSKTITSWAVVVALGL